MDNSISIGNYIENNFSNSIIIGNGSSGNSIQAKGNGLCYIKCEELYTDGHELGI